MKIPKYANDEERDELAKSYIYTTSTQAYDKQQLNFKK